MSNEAMNIVNQILGAVHDWLPLERRTAFIKFRQANNDDFDTFVEKFFIEKDAENARLREALEKIDLSCDSTWSGWKGNIKSCLDLKRRVIEFPNEYGEPLKSKALVDMCKNCQAQEILQENET